MAEADAQSSVPAEGDAVDGVTEAVSDVSLEDQFKEAQRQMVAGLVEEVKSDGMNPALVMFGYQNTEEGFWRYLQQTEWNLENAFELMKSSCDWHTKNGAKVNSVMKDVYSTQPGLFSLRQIGHDKKGRPVLFLCFAQNSATAAEHTVDSVICFIQHIVENAMRTARQGSAGDEGKQCMIIVDCSGIQPKSILKPTMLVKTHQTLSLLYPNTIEGILLFNYGPEVRDTWKQLKGYMAQDLAAKVKFVAIQNTSKMLITQFPADVGQWLKEEIAANKSLPLSNDQRLFWAASGPHDPRAAPSYVAEFIDKRHANHQPHPGIMHGKKPEPAAVRDAEEA